MTIDRIIQTHMMKFDVMSNLCETCNPRRYEDPEWMRVHKAIEPYSSINMSLSTRMEAMLCGRGGNGRTASMVWNSLGYLASGKNSSGRGSRSRVPDLLSRGSVAKV